MARPTRPTRQPSRITPQIQLRESVMVTPDAVGPDTPPEVTDSSVAPDPVLSGTDTQVGDSGPAQGATGPEQPVSPGAGGSAVPNGRILEVGDPVVFDGTPVGKDAVIANEDVYRRVFVRGSKRPTYLLVLRKGRRVNRRTLNVKVPGKEV